MTPMLKRQNCKFFHDSIVSQFQEETWEQRQAHPIRKEYQKASESCWNFNISNVDYFQQSMNPLEEIVEPLDTSAASLHFVHQPH